MKKIIFVALIFGTSLAHAQTNISYESSEKTFKVIPTYGVMAIINDYENLNSSVNTGVALEKMLGSRFSLGLLFNYASFKFNNSSTYGNYNYGYYNYGYNNYGYNNYSYNNLYNYYGQNIKSEIFSVGISSKFFILDEGMLRPFLGGGLTYNRNNLSYDYGYSYGYNQDYSIGMNSFSGLLMAGTELRFSKNIGLNIDFRYIRTLGNNNNYNSYYNSSNYNSYGLESLGRAIEDSDLMSLNAGILIAI